MSKKNVYQEKTSPLMTFLYILVCVILIIALGFMFIKDRTRRKGFEDLVSNAAASEMSVDIASVKDGDEIAPIKTVEVPEPTVTVVPTDTPAPTNTPVPAETAVSTEEATAAEQAETVEEEEVSLPEVFIPEDKLIDESLSKGINE